MKNLTQSINNIIDSYYYSVFKLIQIKISEYIRFFLGYTIYNLETFQFSIFFPENIGEYRYFIRYTIFSL